MHESVTLVSITIYTNMLCFKFLQTTLAFSTLQLVRVTVTWVFFLMGLLGNIFVLHCLLTNKIRSHVHVIMLHLTLADLTFTVFTMPLGKCINHTNY